MRKLPLFKTYIFDLDGVLYRGSEPVPGSQDVLAKLRSFEANIFFFTNNASLSRIDYAKKLNGMGFECTVDQIITSAYGAAKYLQALNVPSKNCYVIGGDGIKFELNEAGINLKNGGEYPIDFVVVGLDRNFTYQKLLDAQQSVFAGAQLIATNRDKTFPVENNKIHPGAGSLVAAVETASGVTALNIGKPETYLYKLILSTANTTPEETLMIGDRLDTDILGGNRAGVKTVFVLTGVNTFKDHKSAPKVMQADWVIKNLDELI